MPKKKRTRTSPKLLVARKLSQEHKGGRASWYDLLPVQDRNYVNMVVDELLLHPEVSLRQVAAGLKEELGLPASISVIRSRLGGLKRDATKS